MLILNRYSIRAFFFLAPGRVLSIAEADTFWMQTLMVESAEDCNHWVCNVGTIGGNFQGSCAGKPGSEGCHCRFVPLGSKCAGVLGTAASCAVAKSSPGSAPTGVGVVVRELSG